MVANSVKGKNFKATEIKELNKIILKYMTLLTELKNSYIYKN